MTSHTKIETDEAAGHHIPLRTKVSYGIGALGKDFAVSIIYLFLLYYYTDVVGISPIFAGTLLLVARILDAFTDPMMGMIVDNTRTRFGKFRPWILTGTVVNAAFLMMVFSTHLIEGPIVLLYATVTYILWGITYTIMDIPYWSMFPALSSSRQEREKLVVWPRIFAAVAWWIIGTYALNVVGILGPENEGNGFLILTVLVTLFFLFSSAITVTQVKEQITIDTAVEKFGLRDVVNVLASNDQLKALFGCVLFFNLAVHLIGSFAIYYFTYVIGEKDLFVSFMFAAGAAEIIGIFSYPFLSRWLPRRLLWFLACGFPALCCLVLGIAACIAPENIWWVGIAGACMKFGFGIANGLSTVMLADVVDYGEYQTGKRSESIIFSVQTVLVKAAGAFAGFLTGVGLSVVGYEANVQQTEDAIWGIRILMMALPFTLMIVSVWIYRQWYRLHEGFSPETTTLNTVINTNSQ